MSALLLGLWAAPLVHIDGQPPAIVQQVRSQLPSELPPNSITSSAAQAHLRFMMRQTGEDLWLGEGDVQRPLGQVSDPEAAVRLAVLIISRRAQVWEPPPSRRPMRPRAKKTTPAPPRQHRWALETMLTAGLDPLSTVDLGGSAAGRFRMSPNLFVGLRALAHALCCTPRTTANVRVEGWSAAGLVEGGAELRVGPVAIGASLGLGAVHDHLDAQVVGLFQGQTAPESVSTLSWIGRVGVAGALRVEDRVELLARLGVVARPTPIRVQLPEPFDEEGRAPVGRDVVSPYGEVGFRFDI